MKLLDLGRSMHSPNDLVLCKTQGKYQIGQNGNKVCKIERLYYRRSDTRDCSTIL